MKIVKTLVSMIISLAMILTLANTFNENVLASDDKFSLNITLGSNEKREVNIKSETIKVKGIEFGIWNVDKTYLQELKNIQENNNELKEEKLLVKIRTLFDNMDISKLDNDFGKHIKAQITDENQSSVIVDDLTESFYYIRQISDTTKVQVESTLLHLPLSKGEEINEKKIYTIYPKTEIVPKKNIGGQKFVKTDDSDNIKYLQGAKFIIAKKIKDKFENIKDEKGKDIVLVSDKNGEFIVNDLPYGNYYLIETQAPKADGIAYSLLKEPYHFKIDANSLKEDKAIRIINKPIKDSGIVIPITGNLQIYFYSLLGISLMFFGIVIYKDKKNK